MRLTNEAYDGIKKLVIFVFPYLMSALFALSLIFDMPYAKSIMGFLALTTLFFGVCLLVSSTRYEANYDGKIVITESEDKKIFALEFDGDPNELDQRGSITFKIIPSTSPTEELI